MGFAFVCTSYAQKAEPLKNAGLHPDPNVVFQSPDTIQPGQIQWTSGKMSIIHGQIGVINGKGKLDIFAAGTQIKGDVASDANGECMYSNMKTFTTTMDVGNSICLWKTGAVIGITHNGHAIGVIKGAGNLIYSPRERKLRVMLRLMKTAELFTAM